jgi:hypothetical protein
MKKDNNDRKFPNSKKQPRHTYADKIGRAQARQEYSDSLTLEQKIAKLPPEPFAKKERAKLLARLEKQNQVKAAPAPEVRAVVPEVSKEEKKEAKRYMRDHQEPSKSG